MANIESIPPAHTGFSPKPGIFIRLLRLCVDIREGEATKALLLSLNVFLLLLAYYILKPLREALLLVDKDSPVIKCCLSGVQAILLITIKAALFLVTPREEKYKAKAAIDTFFVRGGDTIAAAAVLVGTQLLAVKIEAYAFLNVLGVVVWIILCALIIREYRKVKSPNAA